MISPKDTPAQRWPIVNPKTGQLLEDRKVKHLEMLDAGAKAMFEALHFAEGSAMAGEHEENVFTTRRMNIAKTHIETALLFAKEEVMG